MDIHGYIFLLYSQQINKEITATFSPSNNHNNIEHGPVISINSIRFHKNVIKIFRSNYFVITNIPCQLCFDNECPCIEGR